MAQNRGEQAHSAPTHDELLASTTGARVAVVRWQPLRAAHACSYREILVCVRERLACGPCQALRPYHAVAWLVRSQR